jgi:hypothetical protein
MKQISYSEELKCNISICAIVYIIHRMSARETHFILDMTFVIFTRAATRRRYEAITFNYDTGEKYMQEINFLLKSVRSCVRRHRTIQQVRTLPPAQSP